jgi:hypothetical protein
MACASSVLIAPARAAEHQREVTWGPTTLANSFLAERARLSEGQSVAGTSKGARAAAARRQRDSRSRRWRSLRAGGRSGGGRCPPLPLLSYSIHLCAAPIPSMTGAASTEVGRTAEPRQWHLPLRRPRIDDSCGESMIHMDALLLHLLPIDDEFPST